jgi:hypothetical protein
LKALSLIRLLFCFESPTLSTHFQLDGEGPDGNEPENSQNEQTKGEGMLSSSLWTPTQSSGYSSHPGGFLGNRRSSPSIIESGTHPRVSGKSKLDRR